MFYVNKLIDNIVT